MLLTLVVANGLVLGGGRVGDVVGTIAFTLEVVYSVLVAIVDVVLTIRAALVVVVVVAEQM
jgi:hypothetical protein